MAGSPSARVAVSSGSAFVVLLGMLHVLEPGLDPSWSVVSEYQLGAYGWIMTLAFLAMAASCLAGSAALWPNLPTLGGRIGLLLVALAGAGAVLAAVFATDPPSLGPASATPRGRLHELGAMLGGALPWGAALITWGVRRSEAWRGRRAWLVLATALVWAATIAFAASLAVLLPAHGGRLGPGVTVGWQNRAMIAAYALWPAAAAWLATRSRAGAARAAGAVPAAAR